MMRRNADGERVYDARLVATGVPPITFGVTHARGCDHRTEYGHPMYAPMRRMLDDLLVGAAVEAGVELAAIDEWLSGARSFDESLSGYAHDRERWCRLFWNNILAVATAYREGRPQDALRDGERPHVRRWLQSLRKELV